MKIALLGSAASSVNLAPFKDSTYSAWVQGKVESMARAHASVPGDFDIWGCSPAAWAQAPRATRWFEVHRWEPGQPWFSPEYCQFLRDFTGAVYTGATIPEIPNHVVYPIDHIEEKFASYFLTSSLALMLALAIDTIEAVRVARRTGGPMPAFVNESERGKPDDDDLIGMWGVDMAAHEEYAYQRPGCQFFILEAMRRGIAFYLPPESDLMRPMPVYGISEWDHNYIKMTARAKELSQKGSMARQQMEEAMASLRHAEGALGELNCFVQTWTSPYGMQHGLVIRQQEGSGLGSGITHFDGRPVTRMSLAPSEAMKAMTADPDAALGRQLSAILARYCSETGTDGGVVQTLERLMQEAQLARLHSMVLQPHMEAGESTVDAMKRLFVPPRKKRAAERAR